MRKSREPTTAFGKHVEMTADEINDFLAHSGDTSSDDSDWEGIAEVEASEFMHPESQTVTCQKPSPDKTETDQPPLKKARREDIGVGMLFAQPGESEVPENEGSCLRGAGYDSDEDIMGQGDGPSYMSADGELVQRRLKAERQAAAEAVIEREIVDREKKEVKEKERRFREMEEKRKQSVAALKKDLPAGASNPSSTGTSARQKHPPPGDYFIATPTRIRVTKPRISSELWNSRVHERTTYHLPQLHSVRYREDITTQEWVTIGVLVGKTGAYKSKKGQVYSIWRINDLQNFDLFVKVLLFGPVHDALWKECEGSVVALLKPKIMEPSVGNKQVYGKSLNEEVTLTVNNALQILILGHSVDYGICAGVTKAGNKCTKLINTGLSKYCDYHIKKAYNKATVTRPGFVNTTFPTFQHGLKKKLADAHNHVKDFKNDNPTRHGTLTKLTLSKICSGPPGGLSDSMVSWGLVDSSDLAKIPTKGKSVAAAPVGQEEAPNSKTTKTSSSVCRDSALAKNEAAFTSMLSRPSAGSINFVKHLLKTEAPQSQIAAKDKLSNSINSKSKPVSSSSSFRGLQTHKAVSSVAAPKLGRGMSSEGFLELTSPPKRSSSLVSAAQTNRLRAEALMRDRGGIKRGRGGKVKGAGATAWVSGQQEKENRPGPSKMSKEESDRLQKELNRGSKHRDLVDREEERVEEVYFDKLSKKEELEDRLLALHEQKVKLVHCKVCRYKAMSASEQCKAKHHPLVRTDGVRRFFKCSSCKNRTTTLDRYPKVACSKCQGSSFVKTGMIAERKGPKLLAETLELRGEERTFLG